MNGRKEKFMLNMKYIGDETIYPVEFSTVSANVVELKGDFPVLTNGFTLSRLGHKDNWKYEDFTTVYREISGGVQFSNDGSVYVAPDPMPELPNVPIEPYEPTLEELQEQKIREMNNAQQQAIKDGVNVTLSNGMTEHFTLKDQDQTSLMGLQQQVAAGAEQIPWHNSDESEHCKFYNNADMQLITNAAMQCVMWHVTYYRDLRIYIRSLITKEDVKNVSYGVPIPEEYQSEPLKTMLAVQA